MFCFIFYAPQLYLFWISFVYLLHICCVILNPVKLFVHFHFLTFFYPVYHIFLTSFSTVLILFCVICSVVLFSSSIVFFFFQFISKKFYSYISFPLGNFLWPLNCSSYSLRCFPDYSTSHRFENSCLFVWKLDSKLCEVRDCVYCSCSVMHP